MRIQEKQTWERREGPELQRLVRRRVLSVSEGRVCFLKLVRERSFWHRQGEHTQDVGAFTRWTLARASDASQAVLISGPGASKNAAPGLFA